MSQEQIPAHGSSSHVSPALELTEGCVVCLSPAQTGKANTLEQRARPSAGLQQREAVTSIAKKKTQSVKFWQKQLLITQCPVPLQADGLSLGAVEGPLPAGQHLPLVLVLPWGCPSTRVPTVDST